MNIGKDVGIELCRVFGESPDRVQSITITAEVGRLTQVEISRLVTDEEAKEVATLFEYFELVKKGEHKQVHPTQFMMNPV